MGLGVWKTLIGGQERVERDLRRLRRDAIPIDAVWVYDATDDRSGFGWPWQIYQPIPPGPYPDLGGLIQRFHLQGLKVLGYLNPFVHVGADGYDDARRRGYLVHDANGRPIVAPWCCARSYSWVDFTNPAATAWWQARLRAALATVGFDGAMQDFGEDLPANARLADGQPAAVAHNRYPVLFAKAAYQAAQAVKPGGTVFLDRSGYLGSQPYTTGRFTGDQQRTWDRESGIGAVVPAMLSGSLSGWPYWGPDIAGYAAHGELADAEEKELWIRWVELGALAPVMRDHLGSQDHHPVELWTDPDTVAVFRAYARLHTAIEPYLYGTPSSPTSRACPSSGRCSSTTRPRCRRSPWTTSTCWATTCWSPRCSPRGRSFDVCTCPLAGGLSTGQAADTGARAGSWSTPRDARSHSWSARGHGSTFPPPDNCGRSLRATPTRRPVQPAPGTRRLRHRARPVPVRPVAGPRRQIARSLCLVIAVVGPVS